MKALDENLLEGVSEDRSFTVRGVPLTCKPSIPGRALSRFADWNVEFDARGNRFPAQSFEILNELIRGSLETDSRERWDALLDEEDLEVPIDLEEMLSIIDHISKATLRRPTVQPSPSGITGESAGPKSTEGSGSPVALVSPDSISQAS
jgi:hypothetical protein